MNNLLLTVLNLSILCSFLIIGVILLNKIVWKKYSRQWKYIIWAVIAIRLIIPINIRIIDLPRILNVQESVGQLIQSTDTVSDLDSLGSSNSLFLENKQKTPEKTQVDRNGNSIEMTKQQEVIEHKSLSSHPLFSDSVLDNLAIIWMVGVILFLFFHLLSYFNYRAKIVRWSISIQNKDVLEEFHSLCKELNMKCNIRLVTCNQVFSPILIGFIKPCIVLPTQDFTIEQYNYIFKHELIHYKHHDLLYEFILLCANALHWFNPLIHHMVYLANNDIELYCDEKLVEKSDLNYRENYSKLLLQIMTGSMKNSNILLSTGFASKKTQLKNRFFQIMNSKPTKKGTGFIMGLICFTVVAGNLIAWFAPIKTGSAETADNQNHTLITSDVVKDSITNTSDQLEEVNNILVVGIDGTNSEEHSRADSILVVSVNPNTKKVFLTSFLRDMYVKIPDYGKGKLSSVFKLGGTGLIKNTIETNFGISIHNTITVNMEGFEKIIDSIGGVEIELSESEAEYLNTTNYISDKKYRNVFSGKQILNGNQALGYVRVRKVPTLQGKTDDLGRTARLRSLLLSVVKECRTKDIKEIINLITTTGAYVSTDLSVDQILLSVNTVLQGSATTNTISIPVDGSYTQEVQDGMSILNPDLEKNKEVLKQINGK